MAEQTHCHFHRYSDELTQVYRRVGTRPFAWKQISDIMPCGAITRYSTPGYFVPALDKYGKSRRTSTGVALCRIPADIANLCRRAISTQQQDHRYENLAATITGGQECA